MHAPGCLVYWLTSKPATYVHGNKLVSSTLSGGAISATLGTTAQINGAKTPNTHTHTHLDTLYPLYSFFLYFFPALRNADQNLPESMIEIKRLGRVAVYGGQNHNAPPEYVLRYTHCTAARGGLASGHITVQQPEEGYRVVTIGYSSPRRVIERLQ